MKKHSAHPHAHVTHRTHHRIRIKVPAKKGDHSFFERCSAEIKKLYPNANIVTSLTTGSMLLLGAVDFEGLCAEVLEKELFEIVEAASHTSQGPITLQVAKKISAMDRQLKESSKGAVDLRTMTFTTLVGLSLIQVLRGQALGPASALLVCAFACLPREVTPAVAAASES